MRKILTGALAAATLALVPVSGWAAHIQAYGGVGTGFVINDALPGTPDTPQTSSSTINVLEDFTIDSLELTVAMQHTWVGDLQIQLTGAGGTLDIMNRNGVRGSGQGDASDLGEPSAFPGFIPPTFFTYTFSDAAGSGDIWGVACDTAAADPIAAGTYRASGAWDTTSPSCDRSGGANDGDTPVATITDLNAFFNGKSTLGDWTLSVTDFLNQETGEVGSWSLSIQTQQHCPDPLDPSCPPTPGPGPGPGPGPTPTPAPGTLLLMGLGLAGLRLVGRGRKR